MTTEAWAICREVRARRGWSQRRLASAAKTTPAIIARIEKARMEPTVELLSRIARSAGFELRLAIAEPDVDARKAVAQARALDDDQRLRQNDLASRLWVQARRA